MNNADTCLRGLSLEQKIGQMFFARGLNYFPDETHALVRQGLIGGIQARAGLFTPDDLAALQQESPVPLFLAADMETGFTGRVGDHTAMPWAMALGAIGDEAAAYEWAQIAALEARRYGVNYVWGPVLDVAMEPASPMVNVRALSADPADVIRLGAAVIHGYQDQGMQVAAKHYPGMGRPPEDSHIEMACLRCSREEFEDLEMRIYREIIQRTRLNGIMSGHIMVPAVDPDNMATVSPRLVGYLKAFGFNGILTTDSLAMKGIKAHLGIEALIRQVLKSGHDIVLGDYGVSPRKQLEAMIQAVRQGVITPADVDGSVRKILCAKEMIAAGTPRTAIDPADHRRRCLELNRRAITVVGDWSRWRKAARSERVLFIVARGLSGESGGAEIESGPELRILDLIRREFPDQRILTIAETPSPAEMESTLDAAMDYRQIVYITCAEPHSYKGTADLPQPQIALIGGLKERLAVLVLFGNPYAARHLPPLTAVMFPYLGGAAEQAAAEVLAGRFEPQGRLPVHLKLRLLPPS